jgi:predicted MFS family arabinose efflux permease
MESLAMSNSLALALETDHHDTNAFLRTLVIGVTAFLTVVDLFATQAILPSLARAYGVSSATMGIAVNATTIGMAVSGLGVALLSQHINRRRGILLSLALLSIPTGLLATMPSLPVFALLRILQGLLMAAAFSLTLAHLAEVCSERAAASAFAAYITGNVASNLVGRLLSAAVVDHLGLASNFYVFAGLNLTGALLVYQTLGHARPTTVVSMAIAATVPAWREHLRNRALLAAFAVGFCILFAFIGTFTYVNFVLVRPPIGLGMMSLGLVYFVFLPSVASTPFAGDVALRFGTRRTCCTALAVAASGLPFLLVPVLHSILAGLVLVGAGTFFAQACATGFIGRAATADRGSAGGIYLACYFLGGLAGTAVLGLAYDWLGWTACVVGIGLALAMAMILTSWLRLPWSPAAARGA